MTKGSYDVIIVGAGPAGLMLAKHLNSSKLRVLLLEARPTIKRLLNHKYGTFTETLSKYGLERYAATKYKKFTFTGVNTVHTFSYPRAEFQVIDMDLFARRFRPRCDVVTSSIVTKAEKLPDGIVLTDHKRRQFKGTIVVDCAGCGKVISRQLGLAVRKPIDFYSTSFEMRGCKISADGLDALRFMADINYSNVGLWFYPYSRTSCQIGQTELVTPGVTPRANPRKSLDWYIRDVEPYKTWLKGARIVEVVSKIGPTTTLNKKYADDNFLACGDAAGAGTPVVGEGFRVAVEMAASAHQTILEAFRKNDFSRRTLRLHEKNFYQLMAKHYWSSTFLRFLIMHCFDQPTYDIFVHNLQRYTPDEFKHAVASEITLRLFLKMLSPMMIGRIILNGFRSSVLRQELSPRVTA